MSSNSSSSPAPRRRRAAASSDLPIVAGVQVQRIANRGIRCREPGRGGFVKCPDEVRQNPMYADGFGSQKASAAPKSPTMMIQGSSGAVRVQQIANRGFRCRAADGGRFIRCPDDVHNQLVDRFGQEAVTGAGKAPKSPSQTMRSSSGDDVRIQYMRGRGWRCRSAEGAFMRCPDDIDAQLQNTPAPAGMEAAAPAASRARAASPRSSSPGRAASPRASQMGGSQRASQSMMGGSQRPSQRPSQRASQMSPSFASASSGGVRRVGAARR